MLIEESGPKSPQWNMKADEEALCSLMPLSEPILRFYEWSLPSATYGYFLNPEDYFNPEGVKKHSLALAKRPTGGGIIFHTSDLAFSLIVPAAHPFYSLDPLRSYHEINSCVLQAIQQHNFSGSLSSQAQCSRGGFCMAKPTKYDLMLEGKKVGGAAQRKTKKGLLHQGSLYLTHPDSKWLQDVLKNGKQVAETMEQMSFPLGVEIKDSLKRHLQNCILVSSAFKEGQAIKN